MSTKWKEVRVGHHTESRLYVNGRYAGRICHLPGGHVCETTYGAAARFDELGEARAWIKEYA